MDIESHTRHEPKVRAATPVFPAPANPPFPIRKFLRATWLVTAAVSSAIVLTSAFAQLNTLFGIAQGILFAWSPGWFIARVLAETVASLVSLLMAGYLYLKRPDERLVLLTSFFLLVNAVVIAPLNFLESYWPGMRGLSYSVIQPLFFAPLLVAFLAVFPNGRFTPAWTRWLVVAAIVYAPVRVFQFTPQAVSRPTADLILSVSIWFLLIFAGLYAQVYRYRRVSDAVERQQTKWVLYGFSAAISLALLLTIATIGLNALPQTPILPWWTPLINVGWPFAYAALPISLTFAVLRYRLFDIDLIINRTLLYGALTAGVIGLYALVVGSVSVLFRIRSDLITALLATGLVAVLFQPLRERLQRTVNRLTFGERDDPFEALSRLGKRLEAALPQEQVLPTLVETIAQTLKLPYVGISVDGITVAAAGTLARDPIRFPLTYRGERTGELLAAPRMPEESFTKIEMRLLRGLARQAGAAVRNAQLAADLQRSRQSLVTAREEERRRLRRDLHDGLGASLAALHLRTGALGRLIPDDPDAAGEIVAEFRDELGAAIEDIRRLVYALRPPALDELGLVQAIQALAARCGLTIDEGPAMAATDRQTNLKVQVEAPDDLPPLPAAVEVAAYRIVQEALTNVVHHARAASCWVRIGLAGSLCIEIQDDGIGIAAGDHIGMGLVSMRERAAELGGSFVVEARPGGGTRVAVDIPLGGE